MRCSFFDWRRNTNSARSVGTVPIMITVQEAFKEIAEGRDFDTLGDLLNDLSADEATKAPPGCPYSIATQVFHACFWQDRWLKQIQGEHTPAWTSDDSDFLVIPSDDWENLRSKFLGDFGKVLALANQSENFDRPTQFGDTAEVLLIRSALHLSYHLGQIKLLRRMLSES